MTRGVKMIAAERKRQVEYEGWIAKHDNEHDREELATVAALYASPVKLYTRGDYRGGIAFIDPWPLTWDRRWDKREKHSRLRSLAIAGALCAAEIDRLLRARVPPAGVSDA